MIGILKYAAIVAGLGIIPGVYLGTVFADELKAAVRRFRPARKPRPAAAYVPRHAPTLPRRKPLVNRQPWQTAEMPAIRVPAAQLALDPGDGLDEPPLARPYAPENSNGQTADLYFGGDWGTRPELEVREAGRLAGVMLP